VCAWEKTKEEGNPGKRKMLSASKERNEIPESEYELAALLDSFTVPRKVSRGLFGSAAGEIFVWIAVSFKVLAEATTETLNKKLVAFLGLHHV
jgi:hypothetical protein